METGKPGLASVPVHVSSVTTQAEKRMNIQVPLTAVYIHAVPPAAAKEPLQLAMPPLYSKETLPFLTLHLAGGLQPLPGLSLTAPALKPKSAGKHMCPHCGRDCLKPSVLEKHLRCHTGERPYPCSTCGVSFKTQSNLYKHRRTQAHARLSSESEQSSLGSQDSVTSSRETCTSSSSLDEHKEESGSMERSSAPPTTESTTASSPTKAHCVQMQGSVSEQNEPSITLHIPEPNRMDGPKEERKQQMDYTKPFSLNRHLPLQRQEATLFSKQWGSSVSKGKSLSHESTDSGFSDSPGSALLDHSMDSLTESSREHVEKRMSTSSDRAHCEQEPQNTARKQEQELLVERISKLISENTAVVEDKQLENVRPRKTVLSKQGSIDLPMPYTYKNSFHFDMKISPTQNPGLKRYSRSGLSSSFPSAVEHAPLTRSHSLPFNFTLMQPERSSSASPQQSSYVKAVRSGSSGQIHSTDLSRRPVNQNSSAHRPLVRQTAVDCNHATDGPFTNLSVEEVCTGSLSCDGDGGDICGEPNARKFRRKRAQKFSYNKWYMYGGGTFKKLYDLQKNTNNSMLKGKNCSTNPQHEVVRGPVFPKEAVTTSNSTINCTNSGATAARPCAGLSVVSSVGFTSQKCHLISTNSPTKAPPPRRNLSLSVLPLPAVGSLLSHETKAGQVLNVPKYSESSSQLCESHIPSDRKKQRTDDKTSFSVEMETDPNTLTHPPTPVTSSGPQQDTNLHRTPKHMPLKGALFLPSVPVGTSPATSIPVAAKTTFLPKYQLKLPNTRDETLESTSHFVGESKGTDECTLRTSLLPSTSDHTFPSGTTCGKNHEGFSSSPLIQTYKNSSVKTSGFTENRLVLPGTVTTLYDAPTSKHSQSLTSSPAVLHRQFATTTITTSSLQQSPGAVCTLMQSVPLQPAQPITTAAADLSLTTAKYSTSVATIAAVSHHQPHLNPSLLPEQLATAPDSAYPNNKAHVGPDDLAVPCSVGSLDQSAQNVFHVNTADFQICLQIISDEQLALIAPQIEHGSDPSQSQISDIKAMLPENSQNKSQNFGTMEFNNKTGNCEQPKTQKETDGGKSLHLLSTERITPLMSEKHSDTSTSSAGPVFPQGRTQQAQNSSHVSMVTQTQSSAASLMSSALLRDVKSGGTQTLEDEQALFQTRCADSMVIQGEVVSQTVSGQHKLNMSSHSAGTVHQKSTDGELQQKLLNYASCHVGSVKNSGQGLTHRSKMLKGGGWVRHVSGDAGSNASDSSVSKAPEQLDPQTPVYSSQDSSELHIKQSNRRGPSDSFPPPLETSTPPRSDICLGQSSYVQDVSAAHPSSRTPTQGHEEGASLEESAALEDQKKKENEASAAAPPEGSDWRLSLCQVTAEMNHQDHQGSAAATGKETNQGLKTDKVPDSTCTGVGLADMTTLQGEETKIQLGSFTAVCLSEQHPPCLSQSGMLKSPAAGPQEALSPSQKSTSLLKMNPFCPLERNWENIVQNQQRQAFCESNVFPQAHLSETQNLLSKMEPTLPSFSHQEEHQISISVDEPTGAHHRTTGGYSQFLPSESHQHTSSSSDLKHLSFMQFHQVSEEGRTPAGLTETNPTSKNQLNMGSLSEPFTHLDPTDTSHEHTGQSRDYGRSDTNKYQSVFMVSPLYGFQPGEGLSSAMRPVPVCQDHIEDTSSSDDEGKLIIEL